tara:strand:+ start:1960 stop:2127 length:168 start_codon:yes stop_codon:yes gene_type:complete
MFGFFTLVLKVHQVGSQSGCSSIGKSSICGLSSVKVISIELSARASVASAGRLMG